MEDKATLKKMIKATIKQLETTIDYACECPSMEMKPYMKLLEAKSIISNVLSKLDEE